MAPRPAFAILCVILLLAGCAGVPYEGGRPLADEPLAAALRQRLSAEYPPSFRSLHRAVLTARGRQFTFSLYVLVRAPGEIRCVGIDDFGGTLFDALRTRDGDIRVVKSDKALPKAWLREDLMRDIALLYIARPTPGAVLVEHPAGVVGLVDALPDGSSQEFLFDRPTCRPTGFVRTRRGRCMYRLELASPIGITDWVSRYQLDLDIREVRPMPLPDRFFTAETGHAR